MTLLLQPLVPPSSAREVDVEFSLLDLLGHQRATATSERGIPARIEGLAAGRDYALTAISGDGALAALADARTYRWPAPGEYDVSVRLVPAGVVTGTVSASDGAPLAGATVAASCGRCAGDRTTTSGPDGSFRIRGLLGPTAVTASAKGHASEQVVVMVPAEGVDVRLTCRAPMKFRGLALDDAGMPIEGVAYLFDDQLRYETHSAADGAFVFDDVRSPPASEATFVFAFCPQPEARGQVALKNPGWIGDVVDVGTLRVSVKRSVRVRVIDGDAKPVAGLSVSLVSRMESAGSRRTDASGEATFSVRSGQYRAVAGAFTFESPGVVDTTTPTPQMLTIHNAVRVPGRLVSPAAASLSRAVFSVRAVPAPGFALDLEAPVSADGAFTLTLPSGAPPTPLEIVSARLRWGLPGEARVGDREVTLALSDAHAFSRRVVVSDERTGSPTRIYRLAYRGEVDELNLNQGLEVADDDGVCTLWPLRPGVYTVSATTVDGRSARVGPFAWRGASDEPVSITVPR